MTTTALASPESEDEAQQSEAAGQAYADQLVAIMTEILDQKYPVPARAWRLGHSRARDHDDAKETPA